MTKLKAARVTHPGCLIGRELDARAMPMPNNDIYWIVAGRDSITLNIAQDLAALFGTSAQFWLNLQANYDEAISDD